MKKENIISIKFLLNSRIEFAIFVTFFQKIFDYVRNKLNNIKINQRGGKMAQTCLIKQEISWQKLMDIKELKPYFEKDSFSFQSKIEKYLISWQKIKPQELDKLAFLRVLEITNGCTQWAFRRNDRECLSLEQTRKCMKLSMSSIKNKKIIFQYREAMTFAPEINNLIEEGRSLYIDAFKNNIEAKQEEFYALSTAQFLVYGKERIDQAFAILQEEFIDYFTPYFIHKGQNYIKPYLILN